MVINGTNFSVAAGRRTDVDPHTPAANKYGLLRLFLNVSFYSGAPANLTLRGTVPVISKDKR